MSQTEYYNPADKKHGNAAKIWELLRRNPAFREHAKAMLERHGPSSHSKDLAQEFEAIDGQNPIAGFVLRWLFKPKLVRFSYPRQPEDYGKAWTFENRLESGYFGVYEDWLLELEKMIAEEETGGSPLTLELLPEKPFTLDTIWPQTPDLFRFLFEWLWQEYEIGRPTDSPGDYFLIRGEFNKSPIDWRFLEDESIGMSFTTKQDLQRLRLLLAHHDIFAVPRILLQEGDVELLRERFSSFLENLLERQKLVVNLQKYPFFLGAVRDWDAFSFCYARVEYHPEEGQSRIQRTGSGAAMEKFIEMRRSLTFSVELIRDLSGLVERLRQQSDPPSAFLWRGLSKQAQEKLMNYRSLAHSSNQVPELVVQTLNETIGGRNSFYTEERFQKFPLRPETHDLTKEDPGDPPFALLNRLLLEDAYREELSKLWSRESHYSNHVANYYSKLESLMFAVFPEFNFSKLIESGIGMQPNEAVTTTAQLALSSCIDKLRTLHLSWGH